MHLPPGAAQHMLFNVHPQQQTVPSFPVQQQQYGIDHHTVAATKRPATDDASSSSLSLGHMKEPRLNAPVAAASSAETVVEVDHPFNRRLHNLRNFPPATGSKHAQRSQTMAINRIRCVLFTHCIFSQSLLECI